jgi:hypothetical protein
MARETLEQKAMRIAQENGLDYENVLQGMQMGDIDFQMAVAPYMGYKGEIDPSVARFHGFTPEQRSDKGLKLKGFQVKPNLGGRELPPYTYETDSGEVVEIPKEFNTVNAIGDGASPRTWAHEYRHHERTDAKAEVGNRIIDLATSMNKKDWNEALKFIEDDAFKVARYKVRAASTPEDRAEVNKNWNDIQDLISKNLKNNPTSEDKKRLRDFISTDYKWWLENLYGRNLDKTKFPMNNMFKKFMTEDFDDVIKKEERAKTAKTFKESLD